MACMPFPTQGPGEHSESSMKCSWSIHNPYGTPQSIPVPQWSDHSPLEPIQNIHDPQESRSSSPTVRLQ